MTMFEVRGLGRQKGHTSCIAAREYNVDLLPKIKLEMVLDDAVVEHRRRHSEDRLERQDRRDGKIFLSKMDEAICIRNQERGSGSFIEDA